jgi:hypothetical protein
MMPRREKDGISVQEAARLMNVSVKSVRRAQFVRRHGVLELGRAVEEGRIKLGAAEQIAKLSHEDQRAALEMSADIKAIARSIRESTRRTLRPQTVTVSNETYHRLAALADAHGLDPAAMIDRLIMERAV